jgi:hypothetical protein
MAEDYRGIAISKAGDGRTFLGWLDVWNNVHLTTKFPRLFSFARNTN